MSVFEAGLNMLSVSRVGMCTRRPLLFKQPSSSPSPWQRSLQSPTATVEQGFWGGGAVRKSGPQWRGPFTKHWPQGPTQYVRVCVCVVYAHMSVCVRCVCVCWSARESIRHNPEMDRRRRVREVRVRALRDTPAVSMS